MSKKLSIILFFTINIFQAIRADIVPGNTVCMTKTCVIEATNLLNAIDESVSPCDDFYQFSCGKWIQNKQIPEHKSVVKRYTELQDQLNYQIKNLISKTDLKTESREFVRNAKKYYDSCLNTTRLEQLGDKPLRRLFQRVRRILKNWREVEWTETYLKLRKLGLSSSVLFTLSVLPDPQNTSQRILSIDQPSFGLGSRDSVLKGVNDSAVKAYKNLIYESALNLGDTKQSSLNVTVDEIFNFETLMANNSMPKELRRNLTAICKRVTIKDLIKMAPNINWLKIIRNDISENITEDEEIVLYDTQYIESLNQFLTNYTDRFLINYLLWRVVGSEMSNLNEKWFQLQEKFEFVIYGTTSRQPRWEMCIENTKTKLGIALSHLYVKNFFSDNNKEESLKLFTNVVNEFRNSLETNTWMGNDTQMEALKKIDKMKMMIGYPDELMNETKLNEYYGKLQMNSSDYFGNNLKLYKFYNDLELSQLREPVDPYDWPKLSYVAEINAHYNWGQNLVKMPAAILQAIFFNKDRPNYLNYGSIAHIFGHEIIHGFDDSGRQYDSEGNLRNWWDNKTDELYKEKAKCFINQYNNYTMKDIDQQLNGINTQGENIADNGGILQSYRAYLNYVEQNGPEPLLPALDYTPEQLFWISFAVKVCSKSTNEYLKLQVLTDPHSPSKPRANCVVSNSVEFSEAFNCPLGSPMNPVNKCNIW